MQFVFDSLYVTVSHCSSCWVLLFSYGINFDLWLSG